MCFVCCFALVVWAMSKKPKNLFYSVFVCAVVFTGFGNREPKIKEENKTARRRKQRRGKLTRRNWEIGRESAKKH